VGLDEVQRLQRRAIATRAVTPPVTRRRSTLRSLGPRSAATLSPRPRPRQRRAQRTPAWIPLLRAATEAAALLTAALIGIIAALGRLSQWFSGAELWSNLVAFAAAVLALCIGTGVVLRVWIALRQWIGPRLRWLPPTAAIGIAALAGWWALQPGFHREVDNLRTLVGGPAEAERVAIAHQVYAAYRRSDLAQLRRTLERGEVYEATVHAAAAAFGVDPEVLMGVGVVESSFNPRTSKDGGRGVFQITSPPAPALGDARRELGAERVDLLNQRHNAYVAAATLRRYLDAMNGDLFLGLLAYNIGPRNGGLVSIMGQYGARDFVTIQPYLQNLPRDYPIRVLSAALAYRLWRAQGRLPRYEDGENARRIQNLGIPGLPLLSAPRIAADPSL